MWLIDQRLRGRKIPRKVSDSVWGSARGGGLSVSVRGPRSPKAAKGAKKGVVPTQQTQQKQQQQQRS